jgi:hypothetical protein
MSSVPGITALTNPTNFPRVDRIPIDVEQTTGVSTDFGENQFPFGISTLYDRAKDSNTGFPAVNRPLTYTYLADSSKITSDPYHHEALCWVRQPKVFMSTLSNAAPRCEVLGLSAFARYLRSPMGRIEFGNDHNCMRLKKYWRFLGSLKRPNRPIVVDDALAIIFGGRSRILDIGRAYTPYNKRERFHKGIPGQRDVVFFLYLRRNIKDDFVDKIKKGTSVVNQAKLLEEQDKLQEQQKGTAVVVYGTNNVPDFYWCLAVFVNRSGKEPEPWMYSNETCDNKEYHYVGDYERAGFINFVYGGIRMFSQDSVDKARSIIRGDEDYQEAASTLETVELFLGQK